jgi:hypothetical protein
MRKRLAWVLGASIGAVVIAATVDAVLSGTSSPQRRDTPPGTISQANGVSITIEDPIAPGGDPCTPPTDCWSRGVALKAGYRIAGNTGSAWIVKGGGRSFYFWATSRASDLHMGGLHREGYRVVRRIGDVAIFTDGLNLAWRVRRATVWIQAGPTEDSVSPRPRELGPLVKTSKTF